jgi:inosine-uridine nucleoside N-ribohydrolase
MTRNVILIADPGIDGAFAIALALHDPQLNVVGLAATAGNVSAEQATKNIHIVVEQVEAPRWPRLGTAMPVDYDVDGTQLHGPRGLGATAFPCVELHHAHPSDKLIVDLVRQTPGEVTIVNLGPLTALARALDRDREIVSLVPRVVCVGGTWHEPGNASAVAEFHFYCDPQAARAVLRAGMPITLIPLDVMRRLLFSPADVMEFADSDTPTCRFLRQILPYGIGTTSNLYGIEGFYLKDVVGIIAVAVSGAVSTRPMTADVETRGELTRGMLVIDGRPGRERQANVDLATGIDAAAARDYIRQTLLRTE